MKTKKLNKDKEHNKNNNNNNKNNKSKTNLRNVSIFNNRTMIISNKITIMIRRLENKFMKSINLILDSMMITII
jgi:hypothetical protein